MEHQEEQASQGLKTASYIFEFASVVAASIVARYVGLIAMMAVFYFLRPRDSAPRARVGIMISLLPLVLAGMVLQGQWKLTQEGEALAARWEGVESPPFAFTTIDGQRIDSSELRGKRVLLNFWATWCPACRMEVPEINRLFLDEGDSGVVVIGLSNENESALREFLKESPVDYPLVSIPQGRLPAPYDKMAMIPTSFVIDRKGVIDFVRGGYVEPGELKAILWDADDNPVPQHSAADAETG